MKGELRNKPHPRRAPGDSMIGPESGCQSVVDIARALRLSNPKLSRFDPMSRIIAFNDFDDGFCGWTQLVGNYEHTLDSMLPGYAQHTQPQLSNLANWDSGTHGSFDGNYALKIQTRSTLSGQAIHRPRRQAATTRCSRASPRRAPSLGGHSPSSP